ncbi:lipoyl synthase [Candidatus Woesearchaeota archaeon]|nr:lipoyl synthase [Candidatus Woesearchaeota archaeon]
MGESLVLVKDIKNRQDNGFLEPERLFYDGNSLKPQWLTIRPPKEKFLSVRQTIKKYGLHTICAEGHCPNLSECWSGGTATFMVMGDTCTRGCRFCNVKTARQGQPLDPEEPKKLVSALQEMGIFDYIVITSVDRDDLRDQGSMHFANCIIAIKQDNPEMLVEVLIPDFRGDTHLIQNVIDAKPDVIAHNIETVERLQKKARDGRANYFQSLAVLDYIKKASPGIITKSSIMLGLGETEEEVIQAMKGLRAVNVEILTLGQYLRPSDWHLPVKEFITPVKFDNYRHIGESMGFSFVAAGPMVRSSYKAGELFVKHILGKRKIEMDKMEIDKLRMDKLRRDKFRMDKPVMN